MKLFLAIKHWIVAIKLVSFIHKRTVLSAKLLATIEKEKKYNELFRFYYKVRDKNEKD